MSRPAGRRIPPLLSAAVAQTRAEELGRVARALLVTRDVLETGPRSPGRATGRSGRLRGAAAGAPEPARTVPEPHAAADRDGDSDPVRQQDPVREHDPVPEQDPVRGAAPRASGATAPAPDGRERPAQGTDPLELVRRSQAGDADAFGELYDQYVDMVYRYLAYRVGSVQLAEDLTSETFLRALRRIGSWQEQGRDVGAWFVTIARNLVADHYKSSRYRLDVTTEDVGALDAAPVADGPEAVVLARLQAGAVLDAVRRLGPEQQECISLRYLQGLSVAETAQVMGRSEGAVKALQHRAVKALARLLPAVG